MKSELRPCNLCGQKNKIHPLYKRFGYQIVRCKNCGLVYLLDAPSGKQLGRLYSKTFFTASSKFDASENNPGHINARKRIDWILSFPRIKTAAWLDIGCATGDFLRAAAPFVGKLHGNDVSAYAIKIGGQRGLKNMRQGNFASLKYPAQKFDVVSMWDLIEHVSDPQLTLAQAYRVLKPGGYIVLSTGDVESLAALITGRFWHLMIPPLHIYFFSKRTIRSYLQKSGFKNVEIFYPGKVVPLDFLIEKTFRLISPGLGRAVSSGLKHLNLAKIHLPINFFDIMTIRARKPD